MLLVSIMLGLMVVLVPKYRCVKCDGEVSFCSRYYVVPDLVSCLRFVPAQFIPGRTGAGLLILNGFTFYMKNHQAHGKKQWYCSSRDVHGCRADVITYKGVDGRDYISIFRGRHIHDPPRLRQCHDGRFIREKYFFNKQSLQ